MYLCVVAALLCGKSHCTNAWTTQISQSTDLFPKKYTSHECIYTAKVLRTRYLWQGNAALAWCWGSIFFFRRCRLAPFVHRPLPDGVSEVCWNTAFSRDLLKSIAGWHSFRIAESALAHFRHTGRLLFLPSPFSILHDDSTTWICTCQGLRFCSPRKIICPHHANTPLTLATELLS